MESFEWWIIEQKSHDEIIGLLKNYVEEKPWVNYFIKDYPMNPGNLNSVCRIGFVPYNKCIQDRYFYIDKSRRFETLAAGGITTQIYWDYNIDTLPAGWQGAIKQSYFNYNSNVKKPNTLVALLAFTISRYRKRGFSDMVISQMCIKGKQRGYKYLILPVLPPTQFIKENVRLSMEEIIGLKREDGNYYDHWLRMHSRKGAEIVGTCESSHRFIFNLNDFSEFVSSDPITKTGEHVIKMDKDHVLGANSKNMWQLVYADIERSFVTFDWGCVWAIYNLEKLKFDIDPTIKKLYQ